MAERTSAEFMAECRLTFGIHPNDGTYSSTVLLDAVNRAYLMDVCATVAIPEITDESTITVPANATLFPLDTDDFLRINDVIREADSYVVRPADSLNVAQLGGNYATPQPGSIEYWYLINSNDTVNLRVFNPPATDTNLILLRNLKPSKLTNGDNPTGTILHDMFDDALQAFANARVAALLRLYADAKEWFAIGANRLQRASGKDTYGTKVMRSFNAAGSIGDRTASPRSA